MIMMFCFIVTNVTRDIAFLGKLKYNKSFCEALYFIVGLQYDER